MARTQRKVDAKATAKKTRNGKRSGAKATGQKSVTLKEVAKAAGVSLGMASRVLGEYGSYSEATKERVRKAAKELGYRPNALARSLRLGRTKAIGLVVSNIVSYHWTTFIRGIEAAASERGYQVILGTTDDDPATERAYLQTLQERNVDGIIISPSPSNEEIVAQLIESGKAVVLVESSSAALRSPRINIDNRAAAYGATEHLLELGHRRIGIVAGNQDLPSGRERLQGHLEALAAAGIAADEDLVRVGDYKFAPAYRGVEELLTLPEPPTALLVCNELMTGAALQCLKDREVDVPGQVSLVAFDDPAWTSYYRPGITTVRTPRAEIAQVALDTMLAMLTEPESELAAPGERMMPTELVVRESTQAIWREGSGRPRSAV